MNRFLAASTVVFFLAACGTTPKESAPASATAYPAASEDYGPYFRIPSGGLAASAYWGPGYYNPRGQRWW